MSADIKIERAAFYKLDGDRNTVGKPIPVQFNPETLKVGLSNTLEAENSGSGSTSAAQFVSKSESTLSLTLIFDTTREEQRNEQQRADARSTATSGTEPGSSEFKTALEEDARKATDKLDVRTRTKQLADLFMQPQNPQADKPAPPHLCRFQWGRFAFVGMMSSYDETLDFFSPQGIPLRAQLALTLKEDRYQFEQASQPEPDVREQPAFTPGGTSMPEAVPDPKKAKEWRETALFNGIEAPRLTASVSLSAPGISLSGSAALGGASIAAGGLGSSFSASASAPSLSVSGGAGLSAGLTAGLQAGISASAAAAPAKSNFSVGGSSSLGTDIPGAFVSLGGSASTAQGHFAANAALPSASFESAASGGFSANASASASASASANASASFSGAGGQLSAQAQSSADFDFDTA